MEKTNVDGSLLTFSLSTSSSCTQDKVGGSKENVICRVKPVVTLPSLVKCVAPLVEWDTSWLLTETYDSCVTFCTLSQQSRFFSTQELSVDTNFGHGSVLSKGLQKKFAEASHSR
jgi:hypothetical protein